MSASDLPAGRDGTVLEALADSGPATIPELAARLEAHPITVERRCLELQREGCVRQCTGGRVTLVDAGEPDEPDGSR